MYNKKIISEIKRLKFEDFLWIVFAFLCFINIYGDYYEIEFLETNNNSFKMKSNQFFEITLFITLLIYIYFLIRNYNVYINATPQEKELYSIKLFGSCLLIAGILCLLYFQTKQSSFTGSPAL